MFHHQWLSSCQCHHLPSTSCSGRCQQHHRCHTSDLQVSSLASEVNPRCEIATLDLHAFSYRTLTLGLAYVSIHSAMSAAMRPSAQQFVVDAGRGAYTTLFVRNGIQLIDWPTHLERLARSLRALHTTLSGFYDKYYSWLEVSNSAHCSALAAAADRRRCPCCCRQRCC